MKINITSNKLHGALEITSINQLACLSSAFHGFGREKIFPYTVCEDIYSVLVLVTMSRGQMRAIEPGVGCLHN